MSDRRAPRIDVADAASLQEKTLERLYTADVPGAPARNVFWTIARHEHLYQGWSAFSRRLFRGELPVRDRELVILRTALHGKSPYEWAQHNLVAKQFGFTDEEILRIAKPEIEGWSPKEAALLRAADELEYQVELSDATWDELSKHYDTHKMIEIVLLPGYYRMVACFLNTIRVPLEDGLQADEVLPFTPF